MRNDPPLPHAIPFITALTAPSTTAQPHWNKAPIPKRLSVAQLLGHSLGNNPGYSSLDLFMAPDYPAFSIMPFLQLTGLYLTDNTYAASIGIGGRRLSDSSVPLVGLNAFYDYRQGEYGPFHQLSLGIELTSTRWGLSFNGYMPIGQTKQGKTCIFDNYVGNYKAIHRQFETSSAGLQAIGSLLTLQKGAFTLYASGGPYFYAKNGISPSVFGGTFTLQPQYKDYVSVFFTISHDPVFRTLFQGGLSLSLPLYSLSEKAKHPRLSNRQIYQSVSRMPTIPLQRHCCWEFNW